MVIRRGKTITQNDNKQAKMEKLAASILEAHKKAVEKWEHGEIEDILYDREGNFCMEFEDGTRWCFYS